MDADDDLPAPFPDDLGGDLDNLLPSHPEEDGCVFESHPACRKLCSSDPFHPAEVILR